MMAISYCVGICGSLVFDSFLPFVAVGLSECVACMVAFVQGEVKDGAVRFDPWEVLVLGVLV